jgi:hypothetical protein
MTAVALATFAAAALFASFHLPIPGLACGRSARLIGVGYHVLLLPAVSDLSAPVWARMAGFAWMLIDVVLDGAAYVGLGREVVDPLRQGVHLLSAIWVVVAGWCNGLVLGVLGAALGLGFVARFLLSGQQRSPDWLRTVNAMLNVAWLVGIAVVLWP